MLSPQSEELIGTGHTQLFHQFVHHRRTQTLDVHGIARAEMPQTFAHLIGAGRIGTEMTNVLLAAGICAALFNRSRATGRTVCRPGHRLGALWAPIENHRHHLRNDFARFLHDDRVTDADVLGLHFGKVVQRCT